MMFKVQSGMGQTRVRFRGGMAGASISAGVNMGGGCIGMSAPQFGILPALLTAVTDTWDILGSSASTSNTFTASGSQGGQVEDEGLVFSDYRLPAVDSNKN